MLWILLIVTLIIIGLLLYWQLIIAEGAYLGAALVARLYDWTAERYNKIKEFDPEMEALTLGLPLSNRLIGQPDALILDVATGTGRVPLTLFGQPTYCGRVIGLDRASKMLRVARRELNANHQRMSLVLADAMALPFASNSFPLVTCLEALEFLPNPRQGLAELIRVLQPASPTQPNSGWLLFSHRIGWEAHLMPGKSWSREKLAQILADFQLRQVKFQLWQNIYDLVWAQKAEY